MPKLVRLDSLAPGQKFKTPSGFTATLLYANDCRARVKLEPTSHTVTVKSGKNAGKVATFTTASELDIAPATECFKL